MCSCDGSNGATHKYRHTVHQIFSHAVHPSRTMIVIVVPSNCGVNSFLHDIKDKLWHRVLQFVHTRL